MSVFTDVGGRGQYHDWEAEQAARPAVILVHRPGRVDNVASPVIPVRGTVTRVGVAARTYTSAVTVMLSHPTLGLLWSATTTAQRQWFTLRLPVDEVMVRLGTSGSTAGVTVTLVRA